MPDITLQEREGYQKEIREIEAEIAQARTDLEGYEDNMGYWLLRERIQNIEARIVAIKQRYNLA